ncbi:DNA repair exonuclease family protein YhaO [Planococcus halocryophilus Or1]|uniref:DNA repair exonuclease YhaO n=1 Tax=Planococcus halocryophilus TaxID=1215089 RepID=A0A1C7DMM5_9BACL|nr:DNA repair exonuclease [Planococcus halocryophilus]ANU12473.1 DNA repair exonuclease YhaO [Planococcus halocryophilus]EMF48220.1 DNA repair exonuclease family protein YhaO [Planococcus halocryophilus Or1]
MESIRFIHTADLHLGSPFIGMRDLQKEQWQLLKDSTLSAFDRLIKYALKTNPDFVCIVGDIYDGEDRNIRAQARFQKGMQQLAEREIPVVMCYGNHDHLSGNWTRFELPKNVHVFDETVSQFTLNTAAGPVSFTGFSYGKRHVSESMVEHYPVAQSLDSYHIGLLHGSLEGDATHAVYAPFKKEQLLSKQYDYWALGHIHKRQELYLEPAMVYPGNIQGRHRKESGEKGFYEVTLSKVTTQLEFIPTSVVQFDQVEVSGKGIVHMNELVEACQKELSVFSEAVGTAVIELVLTELDQDSFELLAEIPESELLEMLRESVEGLDSFVWIQAIHLQQTDEDAELSPLGATLIDTMASWETDDWKVVLQDLYRHPKSSRFLEAVEEQTIEKLQLTATQQIRRTMQAGE